MTERPVVRVLLHAPLPQLDRLLDYAIPAELADQVAPGLRVRVPLRGAGRIVDGYIVELGTAVDPDRPLSELEGVASPVPVLPNRLYTLARRVADRAAGSASDVLRLVVPRRQARIEKAWDPDAAPVHLPLDPGVGERATAVLDAYPGLSQALAENARVALDAPPGPVSTAGGETVGGWASLLAAAALDTYRRGRSVVLVAPDHRDLDQLEAVLADQVPDGVLIRDESSRTPAERSRAYLRMLQAAPCIVLGNRSAVYDPVSDIGLIAVWDDGDSLLEEPLAPYVHARDAALVRQELDGCALVFAGHTRTADVERLVAIGWLRETPAARRVTARVVLSAPDEGPGGNRVPSAAFRAAREALEHGPVLVQVSRPGYAPVLSCAQCRQSARCVPCGGPLHAARRGAVPECRWCGRQAHGWACGNCAGTSFRLASSGSARTADELGRAFPGTRVILSDGTHPVLRVDARPALVIATRGAEPIAEGGYRAVLLLDGDRMLLAESLRIGEACLRWWSNAAALAAPGAPVHLVGVTGRVARALATWTQPTYARSELSERAPLRMPPTVRVAALDGPFDAVGKALDDLQAAVPDLDGDAVLGPVLRDPSTVKPGEDIPYRALIRFDYAHGSLVTATLRASVIQAALRTRRPAKGAAKGATATNRLKVRVDVPEPEL